jgi:hypothetical protein
MGSALMFHWRECDIRHTRRCDLCDRRAPNDESNYYFHVHGRGKYHDSIMCEACVEARVARTIT